MKNYNEYQRAYQLKRYHERRQEALILLGSRCVVCGSEESLEIDHVDPSTKSIAVSRLWGASKKRWLAEIQKCQLLCKTHHVHKTVLNKENVRPLKGESHPASKLTDDDVRFIRLKPLSQRQLAVKFNVSRGLIAHIQNGRGWNHVE